MNRQEIINHSDQSIRSLFEENGLELPPATKLDHNEDSLIFKTRCDHTIVAMVSTGERLEIFPWTPVYREIGSVEIPANWVWCYIGGQSIPAPYYDGHLSDERRMRLHLTNESKTRPKER